jgi:protein tyrosine kinase modulator
LPNQSQTMALDTILGIWRRRWWLGVLAFLVPFVTAVGVVYSLPNSYRSTATIIVEHQQVPEAFVKSTVTSALETRLHTISQDVLSRSRLEGLIHRFGLYPALRAKVPAEVLIERMRKDIGLELRSGAQRGGTTVAFAIGFRGGDADTVAEVTNTLASFYIEENLKARGRQASGTSQFLKAQLEETKKVLDAQEERLSQFKRRYIGELPQQLTANLTSLEQLGVQLRINSEQQTRALWRRDALASQLVEAQRAAERRAVETSSAFSRLETKSEPPATASPPTVRLQQLRQQLTALRTKYSDKYPEVIRLKAEITEVEREAAQVAVPPTAVEKAEPGIRPSSVTDPIVRQLQASLADANVELQALTKDEAQLRAAYGAMQARVENTPRREQAFEDLSRGHQTTQEHYRSLLKRYEEAQLAEDMEQRQKGEQFRVLDPAIPAQAPAAPNRSRLLLVSLFLSLGLGVGVALLVDRLDTSFHTVDDLRTFTRVPVLASVLLIVTPAETRSRRWRTQLALAVTVLALALLVAGGHFIARGNERLVWLLSGSTS